MRIPLDIRCTEVWGGTAACDVCVNMAGIRGECISVPFRGAQDGGDVYFLSICGMNILSKIVVADVSGHGGEIARVSQYIHESIVQNIGEHDNSGMLNNINQAFLHHQLRGIRFTTMVSLIFDSRDRSLLYAYAGHPAILHASRETGRYQRIRPLNRPRGNLPLGVLSDTRYSQHLAQLERGDILVVYTDAFIEVKGRDGEMIGEAGLIRMLDDAKTTDTAMVARHMVETLGAHFDDDATLVVLEVT